MLKLLEIREKFAEIEQQHVAGVMAAYNAGMVTAWDAARRLVCEYTPAIWPDSDGYEDVIASHTAEEVIDKLVEARAPKEQDAVKPTWSRGRPFCGACGARIHGGQFCSECGKPILWEGL